MFDLPYQCKTYLRFSSANLVDKDACGDFFFFDFEVNA